MQYEESITGLEADLERVKGLFEQVVTFYEARVEAFETAICNTHRADFKGKVLGFLIPVAR